MKPQISNQEVHKKESFLKLYFQELKKIGWKQFWKQNNNAIKFLLKLLAAAFLLGIVESTNFIRQIKTDMNYSKLYFLLTLVLFTFIIVYRIYFYLEVGIKQDFNTSQFSRVKDKTLKGVDWKKAEEPYLKKKK